MARIGQSKRDKWQKAISESIKLEWAKKPNMLCMWSGCLQPVVETKFVDVYTCKSCNITYMSRMHGYSSNEGNESF